MRIGTPARLSRLIPIPSARLTRTLSVPSSPTVAVSSVWTPSKSVTTASTSIGEPAVAGADAAASTVASARAIARSS